MIGEREEREKREGLMLSSFVIQFRNEGKGGGKKEEEKGALQHDSLRSRKD